MRPRVLVAGLVALFGIAGHCAHAANDPCAPYRAPTQPSDRSESGDRSVAHAQGLLWRVQRPGAAPSHLFGTIHLSDPRITRLPPPVRRAFKASDSLTLEVVLDSKANAYYRDSMTATDGRGLQALYDAPMLQRIADLLADYGVPRTVAPTLTPWAAFTLLGRPVPGGEPVLDRLLQQRARLQGKSLHGLERVRELVSLLEGIALEDQRQILLDTVCNRDNLQAQWHELAERYLERDLAGLLRASRQHQGENDLYRRFMQRMLDERNQRMLERAMPLLAEGNTFIAVGALHLPGEHGLLARLEAAGYEVTRIY